MREVDVRIFEVLLDDLEGKLGDVGVDSVFKEGLIDKFGVLAQNYLNNISDEVYDRAVKDFLNYVNIIQCYLTKYD